jgi:dTDP-4-amino-4,6-dideoxygalactose transaminase
MAEIMRIAREHNLQVIEDSCETMFATVHGKSVGSWGHLACFSTYVAHLIVGGVGGLVTTNDSKLAELCRSLLAHGRDSIYLSIDDDDNIGDKELERLIKRRYSFDRVGYSYRATEIEAAIALSELELWRPNIQTRRDNAAYLTKGLNRFSDYLQLPIVPLGYEHSFMMYPIVAKWPIEREALLLHLEKQGIETRYMFPLLSQPIYQKLFPGLLAQYPTAKFLEKRGFFIGMHQGLTTDDIEFIVRTFTEYFEDFWGERL